MQQATADVFVFLSDTIIKNLAYLACFLANIGVLKLGRLVSKVVSKLNFMFLRSTKRITTHRG